MPAKKSRDYEEDPKKILAAACPRDQAGHRAVAREDQSREEPGPWTSKTGNQVHKKDDRTHERCEVQEMAEHSAPGVQETEHLEIDAQRDRSIEGGLLLGQQVSANVAVPVAREEVEIVPEISESKARKAEHDGDKNRQ
jgi:hypothetical protein